MGKVRKVVKGAKIVERLIALPGMWDDLAAWKRGVIKILAGGSAFASRTVRGWVMDSGTSLDWSLWVFGLLCIPAAAYVILILGLRKAWVARQQRATLPPNDVVRPRLGTGPRLVPHIRKARVALEGGRTPEAFDALKEIADLLEARGVSCLRLPANAIDLAWGNWSSFLEKLEQLASIDALMMADALAMWVEVGEPGLYKQTPKRKTQEDSE